MRKRAAQLAMLLILCPGLSFSQGGGLASQPGANAVAGGAPIDASSANEQSALQLLSVVLQLSDSQQRELRAIFDEAAKAAKPIADKMEHNKQATFAAVIAGKGEDEIKRLADEQASLTSQMLVLQAHTFARLWNMLNGMQRSQVDSFVFENIRAFLPAQPQ